MAVKPAGLWADGQVVQQNYPDIHYVLDVPRSTAETPEGRVGMVLAALWADFAALLAAGLLLRALAFNDVEPWKLDGSLLVAVSIYSLWSIALGVSRLGALRPPTASGFVTAVIWLASGATTGGLLYVSDIRVDARVFLFVVCYASAGALCLVAARTLMARGRSASGVSTRVAIVGKGPLFGAVVSSAALAKARGDVAIVDEIEFAASEDSSVNLTSRLQSAIPEVVVLAVDWDDRESLLCGSRAARALPVDLLVPASIMPPGTRVTHRLGGQPLVRLWCRPLGSWKGWVKRFEDIALGIAGLAVAFPIMLVVAILVRVDSSGPVLIRQRRFGYGNQPIYIWKFRTMYWEQCDLSGGQATLRNDPRVTRIGQFLRNTSLDELPQFFNVLKGDMSLVGPRPHPVEMRVGEAYYHDAVNNYAARHRMKPGITGLAQINGCRGLVDTMEKAQKRLDYDLHYVENWSLVLDLVILLRTTWKGFLSEGTV